MVYCLNDNEVREANRGEITNEMLARTEEEYEKKEGVSKVWMTTFYIGLGVEPKPCAFFTSAVESVMVCNVCDSGRDRATQARHLVPNGRVHEGTEDVGQLRRTRNGHSCALCQEVIAQFTVTRCRLRGITDPTFPAPLSRTVFSKEASGHLR